jgi:hypothetical protein
MSVLNTTEKVHTKLKSSAEIDINMEALGNVLLMDALCNKAKVEWAKPLFPRFLISFSIGPGFSYLRRLVDY